MTRPLHRDWRYVGLVALGGACGSVARVLVGGWATYLQVPLITLFPGTADAVLWFPLGTLLVNVLGAFALGYLLEALARRGRETVRRRKIRLGIGTGVLGGFTTYSALALDTQELLAAGVPWIALLYVVLTLAGGTAACLAGIALATRTDRRRRSL
ncbi:fluoride efflux transporter FluC [Promicromonospora thailandica]|uniref:fluoride efflux transporter FluC n=1 Tax=Promicromonospora thailandica TaxID=765201 RepID=UPI0020A4616A|nr:CrcB family protein [Promicromonospora thailandica]BFF19531.1 fluoride efflux transporter CrcB [Promicromonospora thailandica]